MSYENNASDEPAQAADNSNWLGGWFQAAKEKSISAVNMVKKDLAEFTSTMHQDTTRIAGEVKTRVMQESASSATQKVKDGVNNLFDGLSKALSTENSPENGEPVVRKSVPKDAVFNRSKARLRAIQVDPDTYTTEPSGDKETFAAWVSEFDVEKRKEEIAELLVSNVEVRSLYTLLVPMQVKHVDFWTRYFYKVHQLQQDEARRAQLLMRVDVVAQQQNNDGDWEPDSDWGDIEGPNSPTGTEAPVMLSMPVDKMGTSPVAMTTTSPEKAVDKLMLSGLQCPSDAPSDSETSQAASSSDKAASSSFATVTSASSPSTQSAGLEDMECSSSDSDEPLTLKAKVTASPAPPSPTPAAVAAASVALASVDLGEPSASDATLTAATTATATTVDAPPSPHAKDSNGEDDWEKEFDVDTAAVDTNVDAATTTSTAQPASSTDTNAEAEDWESWE